MDNRRVLLLLNGMTVRVNTPLFLPQQFSILGTLRFNGRSDKAIVFADDGEASAMFEPSEMVTFDLGPDENVVTIALRTPSFS